MGSLLDIRVHGLLCKSIWVWVSGSLLMNSQMDGTGRCESSCCTKAFGICIEVVLVDSCWECACRTVQPPWSLGTCPGENTGCTCRADSLQLCGCRGLSQLSQAGAECVCVCVCNIHSDEGSMYAHSFGCLQRPPSRHARRLPLNTRRPWKEMHMPKGDAR